jgi:hypothetical protein
MTIENTETVDGVGIAKDSGEVVLRISDHMEWKNEKLHFELIEKKVGTYLKFVRSGQLLEIIPDAKDRPIRIDIICQYQPTDLASQFLAAAKKQLTSLGIALSYGLLPEVY